VRGQTNQPAWRTLLDYIRPFQTALLAGGLLSLVTAATGLALPLAVRQLITRLAGSGGITGLLVLMSVLVLANAAVGAGGTFLLERTVSTHGQLLTADKLYAELAATQLLANTDHRP